MNILVISHTYIAAINRKKWLVFALKYPNINLSIVVPKTWPGHLFNHDTQNIEKDNTKNCSFIPLDAVRTGNEVLYGYSFKQLFTTIKKINPNIIHVEQGNNAYSYFQAILCAKLLRLKSKFCYFTWINWIHQHSWKYRILWKPVELFNNFFSDGAIAGNKDAHNIISKQNKKIKSIVLPQLGVDTQLFIPAQSITEHQTIAYIGRIVPEKGIIDLLKSFAQIAHKYPTWKLKIIGSGNHKKKLIDYTIKQHLTNRVDFQDPVSHHAVAQLLQTVDILVLPSYDTSEWKEQFGHVLIEAMACKVATIGSTGGEIPHVLHNGGLVFQQHNPKQLSHHLENLIIDKSLRKKIGEQGYNKVHKYYTHEIIAQKTYTFWQDLLLAKNKGEFL